GRPEQLDAMQEGGGLMARYDVGVNSKPGRGHVEEVPGRRIVATPFEYVASDIYPSSQGHPMSRLQPVPDRHGCVPAFQRLPPGKDTAVLCGHRREILVHAEMMGL